MRAVKEARKETGGTNPSHSFSLTPFVDEGKTNSVFLLAFFLLFETIMEN